MFLRLLAAIAAILIVAGLLALVVAWLFPGLLPTPEDDEKQG